MAYKIKVLASIAIISSLVLFSGCLKQQSASYKVNLEIWGVFDDSDAFQSILASYREINPFVGDIKYRKLDVNTYKKDLLDALASGNGPDIFYLGNTWLPSFADKIEAAPDTVLKEQDVRQSFVDVVSQDFINQGKIYAVPTSVDSLALYYNKDLLNAEGITHPPVTWEELAKDVQRLTRVNANGDVFQQGIAMGTAKNINRSTDLLSLLMLQKGVKMTSVDGREAAFADPVSSGNQIIQAGEDAMNFYVQFARPGSPYYSWNNKLHYSIDSFFEGTSAMMINYSWHYPTIKSKNSKLNFAVANVPQFYGTAPVNYANYWGLAVAKNKTVATPASSNSGNLVAPDNSVRIFEAWELIRYLTMKNNGNVTITNGIQGTSKVFPVSIDPAEVYAQKTGKPSGRRDILEKQKSDPILGPFAYGNLIARSWYQIEPEAEEAILADAIELVNLGNSTVHDALELAQTRISQLMRK
jgi:ABC-type glycerol-3-phosphate transport system substrate-binding protein